jgi:serine protease
VASVPGVLEVKFREGREIRLRGGVPVDVAAGRAVALPRRLADAGAEWVRSFPDVNERTLEKMQRRGLPARAARGRAGVDLNLYFRVRFGAGADLAALERALRGLPEVEAVYRVPMPYLPAAPDYLSPANGSGVWQRYVDAAPHGVDARFAWANGFTGAGVKVCDVEYLWNAAHTDLPAVNNLLANPGDAGYGDDHGTAVLGMLAGKADGQGVKGICYGAGFYFAGVYINDDFNVGNAVLAAANAFGTGDVILIEAQILGPTGEYAPVEWYKPYYDTITLAVDLGVVVVAAAGNGSQNLDAAVYSTGNDGHWPFRPEQDSGAILVGAGAPPDYANPRSRLDFSNYGSTVDLQGWGYSVVTTGYGDLYSAEGRNTWFTGTFSGHPARPPWWRGRRRCCSRRIGRNTANRPRRHKSGRSCGRRGRRRRARTSSGRCPTCRRRWRRCCRC